MMKTSKSRAASTFVPDTAPVLCAGGTVVCLATGPSLTKEDAEYCRDKADCVIAVNDADRKSVV